VEGRPGGGKGVQNLVWGGGKKKSEKETRSDFSTKVISRGDRKFKKKGGGIFGGGLTLRERRVL